MKNYPFKFLDAYTRRDRDIFFGREEEIDALYEMVFQSRIIVVYGASGTGKTSLIQCGLANKFKSYDWLALTIRKGSNLNASLHKAICEAGDYEYDEEADKKSKSDFVIGDLGIKLEEAYLHSMLPIYLIFDQFEELYLLGDQKEQEHFIRSVREIMIIKYPVNMIFVIREEYLGYLYDFEKEVPQLMRKKLRVEPMNLDKVRQVIAGVGEYEISNVSIQGGEVESIAESIFNKIRGKEKRSLTIELPYLQVFLDKFYLNVTDDKSRTKEALFTMGALNEMGDIDDVLRDFLEDQAQIIRANLSEKYNKVSLETIWQILAPFATLEGTKEPMAKEVLYDRLPALDKQLINDAIQEFLSSRILRYSENENLYEIAHDSLAQRIAEKRSEEDIALEEIRRLIQSQTSLKPDARELFSEKQLNFIEPALAKLKLLPVALQLIKDSHAKVEADKAAEDKELREANERAEEETRLKNEAQAEREKAIEAARLAKEERNKAKRNLKFSVGATLLAFIVAGFAIGFYNSANEQAIKAQNATLKEVRSKYDLLNERSKFLLKSENYRDAKDEMENAINLVNDPDTGYRTIYKDILNMDSLDAAFQNLDSVKVLSAKLKTMDVDSFELLKMQAEESKNEGKYLVALDKLRKAQSLPGFENSASLKDDIVRLKNTAFPHYKNFGDTNLQSATERETPASNNTSPDKKRILEILKIAKENYMLANHFIPDHPEVKNNLAMVEKKIENLKREK